MGTGSHDKTKKTDGAGAGRAHPRKGRGRRSGRGPRVLALLSVLLGATPLSAGTASAVAFTVTGGGINAPSNSFGCDAAAANCNAERRFDLSLPGIAGGTIDISGGVAVVSLQVLSVSFENGAAGPGDPAAVVFSQLVYVGSANVITSGDPLSFFSAGYAGGGAATVQGLYETFDSARGVVLPATPFDVATSLLNLNCLVVNGTGQCGVQVGRQGFGVDLDGTPTDFVHTFNLSVTGIPEPSTAALVIWGGLTALVLRGSRRR